MSDMKIKSIENGNETKQHLLSLPNKSKKIKQNQSLKIKRYEHHRKTDKRCGSTHIVNDKQVVNFSVAVNDSYKTGRTIEQTTYFDCAYWITANVARLLTKGTLVELTGRVSTRAWTGKDGEARAGLNFHTSQIKLHGGSRRAETVQATAQSETTDLQHRERTTSHFNNEYSIIF
jgi:single-strand DNA-binding protein